MKLLIVGPSSSGKNELANFLRKNGLNADIEVSDRLAGALDDGAAILKLEGFHRGEKDAPAPARMRGRWVQEG